MDDPEVFDPRKNDSKHGETGFCDPLGDEYSENFNIIQFINGNDTPIDSPATCGNGNQQQFSQLTHFGGNNNGHFSVQSTQLPPTMMYPDHRTTFPESPPITDNSVSGSSGSPSSISDAPYSPELAYSQYTENMTDVSAHLIQEMAMQPHNGRGIHLPNHFSHMSSYGYQPHAHGGVVPQVPPQLLNRQMHNYVVPDMLGNVFGRDHNACNTITDIQCANKRKLPMSGLQPQIKTEPRPKHFALTPANGMAPLTPSLLEEEPEEPLARKSVHHGSDDACTRFQFTRFQENSWQTLYDSNQRPLHLDVKVVADKGFNYSQTDGCFVNQKKNHFQITVNIEAIDSNPPRFVKVNGMLKEVSEFKLVFCGVKNEMPTCEIQIKQSQTDRKPLPHEAVLVEIQERKRTKVTVPRLHFSETTMNNHRKHGRPNPEQKFFLLIVKLVAKTSDNEVILIQSYQSERVIVRASNPGQFEPPEAESTWQRNGDTLFYKGSVAIGAEHANANAAFHVNGNMFLTGEICRPSDQNLKTNIYPLETQSALERLQNLRIVGYSYKDEVAERFGMDENNRHRVGVIAQELEKVLPDAVRDNGDFLTVDDTRVFYDTVAAAQELYRLTGQLEGKIDKVEKIWRYKLGENRSLSVSRASLYSKTPSLKSKDIASFFKSKKSSSSGRCQEKCHHEKLLCSSKITQGTIVALVFVMAICMLAMSVLYCMDWYNKSWYPGFNPPAVLPTDPHGPGHYEISVGSNVSWIPLFQPTALPYQTQCSHAMNCPARCCSTPKTMLRGELPEETPNYLLVTQVENDYDPKPARGLPVSIKILNTNLTVDESHCVGKSCTAEFGRYTLYIPIAPSATSTPVSIRIRVKNMQTLHNCGQIEEYEREQCRKLPLSDDPPQASLSQPNEYTFDVSASKYSQSAFKFRVGRVTTLCHMPEKLMGTSYNEYNIVFYRKCHSFSR